MPGTPRLGPTSEPYRAGSRGGPAAKAPPSPALSQPVPVSVANGGRLSPEPVYGVFLLLLNPFVKGMWFVLNEGKMPRKQPARGRLSQPRGSRAWLLSSRGLGGVG